MELYNLWVKKRDTLGDESGPLAGSFNAEEIGLLHSVNQESRREARATALASERVLAKDWLRPEEDEAWRSL